jgi:hypothetical protein
MEQRVALQTFATKALEENVPFVQLSLVLLQPLCTEGKITCTFGKQSCVLFKYHLILSMTQGANIQESKIPLTQQPLNQSSASHKFYTQMPT